MDIDKIPRWILSLETEDVFFLRNSMLRSGSLKEIAKLYGVSYPTVRLRLDKLIQKIELSDKGEEEPFSAFIKGLAVDSRIDLETAKLIIEKYKKDKEKNHEIHCYYSSCRRFAFDSKRTLQKEKGVLHFHFAGNERCGGTYLSENFIAYDTAYRIISVFDCRGLFVAVWFY